MEKTTTAVLSAGARSSGLLPRRGSVSSLPKTAAKISSFTSLPSDLRDTEASLKENLSSSLLRSTTAVAVPRPSR